MSDAGAIDRFDRAVDDLFDHLRGSPVADRVFYVASELGDFSLIWHLLGTAQGAVRPDGFQRAVQLAAALGVESLLVNGVIKSAFRRERPVHEHERPHNLRTPRTTSFPSGHASSAFFAATLLSDAAAAPRSSTPSPRSSRRAGCTFASTTHPMSSAARRSGSRWARS